jgi:putative addiction module killer protein
MASDSIQIEVRKTPAFDRWIRKLGDLEARARILARLRRLTLGNFGDARAVGARVFELRIDHGPGYRVYFMRHGEAIVLLLCAGDKRTQKADIRRAQRMVRELTE